MSEVLLLLLLFCELLKLCHHQIVALLGMLVYKFYGEELREMFGYEEHPYGFYTMAGMHNVINDQLYVTSACFTSVVGSTFG